MTAVTVRDSVESRLCDRCETDTNHDVELTRYSSDHTEEITRCSDCGHASVNTYTEREDA